jgi:hypothetical protein
VAMPPVVSSSGREAPPARYGPAAIHTPAAAAAAASSLAQMTADQIDRCRRNRRRPSR